MRVFLLALLLCAVGVQARLVAEDPRPRDRGFSTQGLEVLQQRYGVAYPGYESGVSPSLSYGMSGISTVPSYGMSGISTVPSYGATTIPSFGATTIPSIPSYGLGETSTVMPSYGLELGAGATTYTSPLMMSSPSLSLPSYGYGGVGAFGAGGEPGMGSKKGTTTVASPIYAQSMVVPKVITQPILRPHVIAQPIEQQQLVQQPIVETRRVIQPVIRRIITQPIIRPEVYESTTIQPSLKQETIVQPHLIEQTIVTPQMQNQFEETQPVQEKPRQHVQQPVVQPTQQKKSHAGGVGAFGF